MPAERSRGSKRPDSEGNCKQLVWSSVEPSNTNSGQFSFSTDSNITSTPFTSVNDAPPPLVDSPALRFGPSACDTFIFTDPSLDLVTSPTGKSKRQPHTKKKPENYIPRPPNAFILFRSSFIKAQHVSSDVETNHSTLSKIAGLTWQSLPDAERAVWHAKAREALDEHKVKYPEYAFRPLQTKTKNPPTGKRKVREVSMKDPVRMVKIAELLVNGKSGDELKECIAEYDKNHVPEIVTRFEAPITARAYRRSSSAPVPDTETGKKSQSFLQFTAKHASQKKLRASSTRPTRCPTPVLNTPVPASPSSDDQIDQIAADVYDEHTLKESSAFDFTQFSFDNVASPMSNYAFDPLMEESSMLLSSYTSPTSTDLFNNSAPYPPALSVNVSFTGDWSQSTVSSPVSPSTPEYIHTPMMTPTLLSSPTTQCFSPNNSEADFAPIFDFFDTYEKPTDVDEALLSRLYQQQPSHHYMDNNKFNNVDEQQYLVDLNLCSNFEESFHGQDHQFHQQPQQMQHAVDPIDLDFTGLMNYIPQYGNM